MASKKSAGQSSNTAMAKTNDKSKVTEVYDKMQGFLKATHWSKPYYSSLIHNNPQLPFHLLEHVNCTYLSTPGRAPTLLSLKQHAQSLAVLISLLAPSQKGATIGPDGTVQADDSFAAHQAFDWLNNLRTHYHTEDESHSLPLNALANLIKCNSDTTGPKWHCPMDTKAIEYPEQHPFQQARPFETHMTLLMHANEILERLDHEYSAYGGILSIIPLDSENVDEQRALTQAKSTLVGQWILYTQHLVARMHELEISYGNCLDLLANEAVVPMHNLSAHGPDGRSGREIVFPQDRWILANAGEDVFSFIHQMLDRAEAHQNAQDDVFADQQVLGDAAFASNKDNKYRGIVKVDLSTRFYRLRDSGHGPLFVLPAFGDRTNTEHTRDIENRPTVVAIPQPSLKDSISEWEKKYKDIDTKLLKMTIQNGNLAGREQELEAFNSMLQKEIDRLNEVIKNMQGKDDDGKDVDKARHIVYLNEQIQHLREHIKTSEERGEHLQDSLDLYKKATADSQNGHDQVGPLIKKIDEQSKQLLAAQKEKKEMQEKLNAVSRDYYTLKIIHQSKDKKEAPTSQPANLDDAMKQIADLQALLKTAHDDRAKLQKEVYNEREKRAKGGQSEEGNAQTTASGTNKTLTFPTNFKFDYGASYKDVKSGIVATSTEYFDTLKAAFEKPNDMQAKLDEAAVTIAALTARVTTLNARQDAQTAATGKPGQVINFPSGFRLAFKTSTWRDNNQGYIVLNTDWYDELIQKHSPQENGDTESEPASTKLPNVINLPSGFTLDFASTWRDNAQGLIVLNTTWYDELIRKHGESQAAAQVIDSLRKENMALKTPSSTDLSSYSHLLPMNTNVATDQKRNIAIVKLPYLKDLEDTKVAQEDLQLQLAQAQANGQVYADQSEGLQKQLDECHEHNKQLQQQSKTMDNSTNSGNIFAAKPPKKVPNSFGIQTAHSDNPFTTAQADKDDLETVKAEKAHLDKTNKALHEQLAKFKKAAEDPTKTSEALDIVQTKFGNTSELLVEIERLEGQVELLEGDNKFLRRFVDDHLSLPQGSDYDEDSQKLKKQYRKLERDYNKLQDEATALHALIDANKAKSPSDAMFKNILHLTGMLREKDGEIAEQLKQINLLIKQRDDLINKAASENNLDSGTVKKLSGEVKDLKVQLEAENQKATAKDERIDDLTQQIIDASQNPEFMNTSFQVAGLRLHIDNLRKQLDDANKKLQAGGSTETCEKKCDKYKKNAAQLQAEVDRLREESRDLEERLGEANRLSAKVEAALDKARQDAEDANEQYDSARDDLLTANEASSRSISELEDKIARLEQQQYPGKDGQAAAKKLADLTKELKNVQGDKKALLAELKTLYKKYRKLEKQYNEETTKLENQWHKEEGKTQKLKKALQKSEDDLNEQREANVTLSDSAASLKTRYEAATAEAARLFEKTGALLAQQIQGGKSEEGEQDEDGDITMESELESEDSDDDGSSTAGSNGVKSALSWMQRELEKLHAAEKLFAQDMGDFRAKLDESNTDVRRELADYIERTGVLTKSVGKLLVKLAYVEKQLAALKGGNKDVGTQTDRTGEDDCEEVRRDLARLRLRYQALDTRNMMLRGENAQLQARAFDHEKLRRRLDRSKEQITRLQALLEDCQQHGEDLAANPPMTAANIYNFIRGLEVTRYQALTDENLCQETVEHLRRQLANEQQRLEDCEEERRRLTMVRSSISTASGVGVESDHFINNRGNTLINEQLSGVTDQINKITEDIEQGEKANEARAHLAHLLGRFYVLIEGTDEGQDGQDYLRRQIAIEQLRILIEEADEDLQDLEATAQSAGTSSTASYSESMMSMASSAKTQASLRQLHRQLSYELKRIVNEEQDADDREARMQLLKRQYNQEQLRIMKEDYDAEHQASVQTLEQRYRDEQLRILKEEQDDDLRADGLQSLLQDYNQEELRLMEERAAADHALALQVEKQSAVDFQTLQEEVILEQTMALAPTTSSFQQAPSTPSASESDASQTLSEALQEAMTSDPKSKSLNTGPSAFSSHPLKSKQSIKATVQYPTLGTTGAQPAIDVHLELPIPAQAPTAPMETEMGMEKSSGLHKGVYKGPKKGAQKYKNPY